MGNIPFGFQDNLPAVDTDRFFSSPGINDDAARLVLNLDCTLGTLDGSCHLDRWQCRIGTCERPCLVILVCCLHLGGITLGVLVDNLDATFILVAPRRKWLEGCFVSLVLVQFIDSGDTGSVI